MLIQLNLIFEFEAFFYQLLICERAVILYSAEKLYEQDDLCLSSFSNPSLTQACCTDCNNMTSGHTQNQILPNLCN